MKYPKVQEEDLKIKVARDFFGKFDCTEIVEKIDFTVKAKKELVGNYFLWAEAKADVTDVCAMLTQLVLTIGKARTFDKIAPPPFLGCFDREKIVFIPYHSVQEIFYQNDFNWKVAPSHRNTREFKLVYELVENVLSGTTCLFDFTKDVKALKQFIAENFIIGKSDTTKTRIDKNNFISIYNRWLDVVKPTIAVDWKLMKKAGIIDGDFYLADLLARENKTLREKLFVLLKSDYYELDKRMDITGLISKSEAGFTDKQKAHHQFWATYERPPLEEYWDYIIERRDLLVPQDIRERKGSFFTPRIWVELSQKYIADVLGENWQDEYYVWDCAAGTGNLLTGLTNKYNVWASTLDKADVDVMHDRIDNGANLLKDHVFQFDFLNDDFSNLPKGLQDIINNPKQRKKLIVYINPPYAESGDSKQLSGTGKNKSEVSFTKISKKYKAIIKNASKEIFAQFLTRIYCEIPDCKIANFSKIKNLQSSNFAEFRNVFQPKLEKVFLVPARSFDNVKGNFPIGFFVWNAEIKEKFERIVARAFEEINDKAAVVGKKTLRSFDGIKGKINEWLRACGKLLPGQDIGILVGDAPDFQHNRSICIQNEKGTGHYLYFSINASNLIAACIYFTVRQVIPADWLNDRDQFLFPKKTWKNDIEFQNDCLAYTLFSNNIQSKYGVNHWIPFLEKEINARDKFDSHFMMSFISGKLIPNRYADLFEQDTDESFIKRKFSAEAKAVFAAGKKLWIYYHKQPKCNVNASLYDIREHFQGRNDKGKIHSKSNDETYNGLIAELRSALKILAEKIEPKVYEYGFLKE